MSSLIPSKDNPHPLLKLQGKERQNFAIKSILVTVALTIIIYIFPGYYGLEKLTTMSSYFLLDLFGFHPRLFTYEDTLSRLGLIDRFLYNLYDSKRATYPAISIQADYFTRSNYLIIRACTGMQAGALLVGLIWATPAKTHDRIRSTYVVLLALFIGNVMRIAAMIAMTTIFMTSFELDYEQSWHLSHDIMGRPLGFIGTIGFTLLIEMRNVKILDTIQVWIDWILNSKPKETKKEIEVKEKSDPDHDDLEAK
ncbi:MAG: exosortase/archaeosortase family protein [Candidatus Heimdallarchaeota archaeon]|nr:exosortase/archaeosortase family protein [Candidatus Heimdallarchaeota archaeon]